MDIKAYIESGILEAYVLGSLSEEEVIEVQANMTLYPEIAAEAQAIEDALFNMAKSRAVTPSASLKEQIWGTIYAGKGDKYAPPLPKTIPLSANNSSQRIWKFAAMIALLLGSVVLNIILLRQGIETREERIALAGRVDKLQKEQDKLVSRISDHEKAKYMMADTAMQTIVMHTMVQGHPMAAVVYWSRSKGETYVTMNALPPPPDGMQYQLWVIQKGKAVSMGTLPNEMANSPTLQKIDMPIMAGEAFAISLEKEGGSPTPTSVYVLGKV